MQPPKIYETGTSLINGIRSKLREILVYLYQTRLIAGPGIRLTETPSGILVSADRQTGSFPYSNISWKKRNDFEYTGPFSLYIASSTIQCRPGLLWQPGQCQYCYPVSCAVPECNSVVLLSSSGVLSTLAEDNIGTANQDDPGYWNTHAILGKYDAETEEIKQYHFSAIVYFIQTEDFVIAT